MTKPRVQQMIEVFLEERRRSTGGWAEVRLEDVKQLCEIINTLIQLKFDKDPDGDLPIEYTIVDRTRFERMSFEPVPYHRHREEQTLEEKQRIFDMHMLNLAIAHGAVERMHRILQHERVHERNKNERR